MNVAAPTAKPIDLAKFRTGIFSKLGQFANDDVGVKKIETTLTALIAAISNQTEITGDKENIAGAVAALRQACTNHLPKGSPAKDRIEARIEGLNRLGAKKEPKINITGTIAGAIHIQNKASTTTILQNAATALANNFPASAYSTSTASAQTIALATAINQSTKDGKLDSEAFINALKSNPSVKFSEEFISAAIPDLKEQANDISISIRALLNSATRVENGNKYDSLISTQLRYGEINFPNDGEKTFNAASISRDELASLEAKLTALTNNLPNMKDAKEKQAAVNLFISELSPAQQAYLKQIVNSEGAKAEKTSSQVNIGATTANFIMPLVGGWIFGKLANIPVLGVFVGLLSGSGFALRSLIPDKQAIELKDMLLKLSNQYFGEGNMRKTVDSLVESALGSAKEKLGAATT